MITARTPKRRFLRIARSSLSCITCRDGRREGAVAVLVGVHHRVGREALAHERAPGGSHRRPAGGILQELAHGGGERRGREVGDDDAGPAASRPAIPDTGVETTGVPAASASSVAIDWPSESEDITSRSARAISARASGRAPVNVTSTPSSPRAPRAPRAADRRRRPGSARRRTSAAARRKRAGFLTGSEPADEEHERAVVRPVASSAPAAGRRDAVVDHARSVAERRDQVLGDDTTSSAARTSSRAAPARSPSAAPWWVASTRRAPRAAGEPARRRGDDRRLGVVRMHDVRAEGADERRLARGPLGDPERRAPALGQHEPPHAGGVRRRARRRRRRRPRRGRARPARPRGRRPRARPPRGPCPDSRAGSSRAERYRRAASPLPTTRNAAVDVPPVSSWPRSSLPSRSPPGA